MLPSVELPVHSVIPVSLVLLLSYLLYVRLTRWRVYKHVHHKYEHRLRDLDALTPAEAQDIIHASMLWDMPSIVFNSLSFAIVRTYAIPSISRVLCGTKELRSGPTVSKRYLDTAIIAATWGTCPISTKEPPSEFYAGSVGTEDASTDPRTFIAVARMNWIHSHYKISNDDYLYTLALFIFEPIKWIRLYGWRPLSDLEIQARYVFYRQIGEMMGIKDIPSTVAELEAWAEDYETREMLPADTNHALAEGMLEELVSSVPSLFRGPFKRIAICAMDDRMRVAMKLPQQPRALHDLVSAGAAAMRVIQRHFLPPRAHAKCIIPLESGSATLHPKLTRSHPILRVSKPWYAPRTVGPKRLLERLALAVGLLSVDDIPSPQYSEEGYRLEELGPHRWKNTGHAEVMQEAGEMMGCPVRGIWARDG
ncbi:unnamed protein product [Peniophora sp. CBMAI 1063]|nr:unnamed protein product [Peniophora sp. CBMAI 1063]